MLKEKIRTEIKETKVKKKFRYIRTAINMLPHIEKIPYDDVAIEFAKRGVIVITMVMGDKHLIITKDLNVEYESFDDEVFYSFFIGRQPISFNIISLSDFAVKFTDYLEAKDLN